MPIITNDTAEKILKNWNISFRAIRKDIVFYGSPQRLQERHAIESTDKKIYILEKIYKEEVSHKEKISNIINLFYANKLPVAPYIKNTSNTYTIEYNESFYILSKFVEGVSPQRPKYVEDSWRGKKIGEFLIQLHNTNLSTKSKLTKIGITTFSLKEYITSLQHKISHNNNEISKRLLPIFDFIKKELLEEYDKLPIGLSHGDIHIMNIVWGKENINAVIDWEFFGYKPEIYDLALSIGCIGIEHPNYLQDNMAVSLIKTVYAAGIYKKISWKYFYEIIITIRLVWLESWLKNNDKEMIDLELTYIEILIKEKHYLKQVWEL